jgi:hypothetical protein
VHARAAGARRGRRHHRITTIARRIWRGSCVEVGYGWLVGDD